MKGQGVGFEQGVSAYTPVFKASCDLARAHAAASCKTLKLMPGTVLLHLPCTADLQVAKMSSEQDAVLAKLGEVESFQGNLQTWLADLHAAWQNAAAANQSFRGGVLNAPPRCF
jgi:hypothetical protein